MIPKKSRTFQRQIQKGIVYGSSMARWAGGGKSLPVSGGTLRKLRKSPALTSLSHDEGKSSQICQNFLRLASLFWHLIHLKTRQDRDCIDCNRFRGFKCLVGLNLLIHCEFTYLGKVLQTQNYVKAFIVGCFGSRGKNIMQYRCLKFVRQCKVWHRKFFVFFSFAIDLT